MDIFAILLYGIAIFYIGLLVYLANQMDVEQRVQIAGVITADTFGYEQRKTVVRWMSFGVAAVIFVGGFLILQVGLVSTSPQVMSELQVNMPQVDQGYALFNFGLALLFTFFSIRLVLNENTRQFLKRLAGANSGYNPESYVHNTAVILGLAVLSLSIGQLILSGGLTGMANQIENSGFSLGEVVFQTVLMVAIAFLGVGLMIRRDVPHALTRLGLRIPTSADVTWGLGVGILLYIALIIMALIWASLVPIEQITQQSAASKQIAESFSTIPLALFLSASAAVGEEILFRGALQPIFGLRLTSLFFALLHMQYTLTPATIIIFVVAIGLGLLRQRQSTTASILAHFTYNFVQLALVILVPQMAGV